jgi:hypothetical protein
MKNNDPSFSEFISSLKSVPNFYKNLTDGLSQTASVVASMNASLNESAKLLVNFNLVIKSLVPDIRNITNFVDSFKKFRIIEKQALIDSGWFLCPSLDPLPYIHIQTAVIQYNAGKKDSITNLMKSAYGNNDWEYLEKVVNNWSPHKFFTKQRMKIIHDAFEAHKAGKYTLSIPALLPIVEGICGDFCNTQKVIVGKGASSQKARTALNNIKANGKEYVSELVLEFIENQLYIYTDSLKNKTNRKFLNRHGILHGSYSGYADCARSLRCFLILDVLTLL